MNEFTIFQKFWAMTDNFMLISFVEFSKEFSHEMKKLSLIENQLKVISKALKDNTLLHKFEVTQDKVLDLINGGLKNYEEIYKSIEDYLENKKKESLKYYYLSNEELMEVYMSVDVTDAAIKFISKLVPGVKTMEFTPDNEELIKMTTEDKEVFILKLPKSKQVIFKEIIETIDSEISKKIGQGFRMCKKDLREVKNDIKKSKEIAGEIVKNKEYLSQSIFTVIYSSFSENIEKALKEEEIFDKLIEIKQESKERKKNLVRLLKENTMTEIERKKAINLICCENFFSEVIKNLIREDVSNPMDFNWTRYIYMSIDSEECTVRHLNYNNVYGYQLVSLFNNFVITPQTERVFITMTNNFVYKKSMYFYGFTNAGKKESINILSKLIGHSLIGFHMTDYFDVPNFKHLIYGASKTGNWLVINNFNSLSNEGLSIISQDINSFYQTLADFKIDANSNSTEAKQQAIRRNMQIFCLSGNIKNKDPKINTTIINYFRLIGLIAPDLLFIIATSLRNYKVPEYKVYSRKIKLAIEYYNNKIKLIEKDRIEITLFNKFLKFFKARILMSYDIDKIDIIIKESLLQTFSPFLSTEECDGLLKYLNALFNIKPEKVDKIKDTEEIVNTVKEVMKKYHFNNLQYRNKIISVITLTK